MPRPCDDNQGISESNEDVGDGIKVGRGVDGGLGETVEVLGDQGDARLHDRAGRARQHRQLLAGVGVELAQGQRMGLNSPDGVAEGGQRPVGERGAVLGGVLECGVEQCRELTDDGGFEQIVLTRPSTVDRHVRHAGVVCDKFDGGPFDAEVPEDADRAIENLRPGGVGLRPWHSTAFVAASGVDQGSLTTQFRGVDAADLGLFQPCSASYYPTAHSPEPGRCRHASEPEVGHPFPQVAVHLRGNVAAGST